MRQNPFPESAPVRLAHAIHSGGFYGAEKVVCDLTREQLASPEFSPRLLAILDPDQTGNEVSARVAALGAPVIPVQVRPGLTWSGLRAYSDALIADGIELVHSHGYKATSYHLCSRWMGLHRVPLVVTAHGYPKGSGNRKATLYRWLDLAFLGGAESVVAVSREMESYLRARNPACRVRTIPNGISREISVEETHPLPAALGLRRIPGEGREPGQERDLIIGSAGRLVPMKNHALLIRAYAEVRKTVPCRLAIIGEGPLRSSLEALWRDLIPGESPGLFPFQKNVLDWVADMDVFSLPSNDGEGLPIALLEAGLLERAVVCSDSGGMPELVRDRVTGRVFPMGDLQGLIRALRDVLTDPEKRRSYGKALRREVVEGHDIRATHGSYLETYAQVLAGP